MAQDLALLDELFSEAGLLKVSLPHYEPRPDQHKMARQIWESLEGDKTALFEAGTGIGKSMAYLIPSLLWSYRTGEKIVISTYTIALQEQLIEKDIPNLLCALGLDLTVVLAKGMGNYVCLRKLQEADREPALSPYSLGALEEWSRKTHDGSKSSLPVYLPSEAWNGIAAEAENCSYMKCPHYKQCFFFKARKKVQEADIIIVNHHLLMAHLLAEEGQAILPPFSRLILDEAHHLESVARHCLTRELDRVQLFRVLAKVHSDAHPEASRLYALRDVLQKKQQEKLKTRVELDIPGEKRVLIDKINGAFDLLDQLHFTQEFKWRLTPDMLKGESWQKKLMPAFSEVKEELKRYRASLDSIEKEIDEETKPQVENALIDIASTSQKAKETISLIEAFFKEAEDNEVRWAEKTAHGLALALAELDVAPFLKEKLFSPLKSAVLCSATLTVGKSFEHLKTSLGLPTLSSEALYPSPFDFKSRVKLCGLSNMPEPNAPHFTTEAAVVIEKAIKASGGGAFVLFTSYDMLKKCADLLAHLSPLVQGEQSRHLLLEEFKEQKNGILFGTDSFWEGVDVMGHALRLVIIVKLPFPVPSDPLLQAKAEALKNQGRNPFNEGSLPQAVVKFKQGFGRLMRHKEDRGCVLCLDTRLFTRSYGALFLQSLPECMTSFDKKEIILEEMRRFYTQTNC